MKMTQLTIRMLTLALPVVLQACTANKTLAQTPPPREADAATAPAAPSAPAAEASEPAPARPMRPAAPPAPPTPKLPGWKDPNSKFEFKLAPGGGFGSVASGGRLITYKMFGSDTPAIITTGSMDASVQAEWKEDLGVMNKLLLDKIAGVGGGDTLAMGIRLTSLPRSSPMYVEDCGVIISAGASRLLAPGKSTQNKSDKPRDPMSAWEKARRELSGLPADPSEKDNTPAFDQAKVDELINTIVGILPEASHIRHLKDGEFVLVTVSGFDDDGNPVRLTLRAKKADIDQAASGQLKPDEFRQRVTRRIG